MNCKDNKTVSTKWSHHKPSQKDCNFNMSPVFSKHKIETAFGKEYIEEFCDNPHFAEDIFVKKYLHGKKVDQMLSLCCGFGRIERRIVRQLGGVSRCVGVDVAEGALAQAIEDAKKENLECLSYICADLNTWNWDREKYDLVIAYGSLHHLKNLDRVLDGIFNCLNEGGMLFAHEYIGLPYYACSPRQLQLINAIAYLVPPELRMRKGLPFSRPKSIFRFFSKIFSASSGYYDDNWPPWKKTAVHICQSCFKSSEKNDFGYLAISPDDIVQKTDPSEGISAQDILSELKKRFRRLDIMHSGGALLEHALDNQFYSAFDTTNPDHVNIADLLWRIERFFENTGEIGPHNAYLVAIR